MASKAIVPSVSVLVAAARPATAPHSSKSFRIDVACDYAAGEGLGCRSLASQDASNNALKSDDARLPNFVGWILD
jgi:hypothetical protein